LSRVNNALQPLIKSNDDIDIPNEMSTYVTIFSISMIVALATLTIGNFLHKILFRLQNPFAVYNKYSQVNLLSYGYKLETVDKLTWLSCLTVSFIALLKSLKFRNSKCHLRFTNELIWIAGLFVMALSVLVVSPLNASLDGVLWFGFGDKVFLATCFAMPIAYSLNLKNQNTNWITIFKYFLFVFVLYDYLPTLLQPLWAIKDPANSSYILNEVIAPFKGQIPTFNFAAQYTNLFGFVFQFIAKIFLIDSQLGILQAASIYLTVLVFLTFCVLFLIGKKITSGNIASIFPIGMIMLILVTPSGVPSGIITNLFSAAPIRVLPVYLVGILLLRDRFSRGHLILLGLLTTLALINNLEFGIPIFIATLIVMLFHPEILIYRWSNFSMFFFGSVAAFFSYFCMLKIQTGVFISDYWLLFASSFGKGFGSEPMPLGGIHIFTLGVFSASIALGALKIKRFDTNMPNHERRAAIVSLFFGLVGLGAFPYFVNRSVISGQLQIFLFIVAPLLCSTFSIVQLDFKANRRSGYLLASALLLFPQALIVGSYLQRPDGGVEWTRVVSFASNPYSEKINLITALISSVESTLGQKIEYGLISQGNMFLFDSHLKNVSLIDQPSDARYIGAKLRVEFCSFLDSEIKSKDSNILAEGFFAENGLDPICEGYVQILDLGKGLTIIKQL